MGGSFALRGDICWSKSAAELSCVKDGYLVCENGVSRGVFEELPAGLEGIEVIDRRGRLVVPGLVDLHLHAPQYGFRGLGMDLELLDWLDTHAFPEEGRYADLGYAERAYQVFADDLLHSATTRAVVFGTIHVEPTLRLMDLLEETGLKTFVGKVNMDRNSPDYLRERSAKASLSDTRLWLGRVGERGYENTLPILTPRFTPSCTDELMAGLGQLREELRLPLQSHLSENLSEVEWVRELCPWSSCYGQTYERFGHLSGDVPSVMAHCNYCPEEEIEILKGSGCFIAHCPQSNTMLSSGIAPIRDYLERGMNVGLGTDIAGGASLSLFRAMADAVGVSKLRWCCVDETLRPLSTSEAFYLATAGGGSFFGKVGSFDQGFEFDALVLDDSALRTTLECSLEERLERYVYLEAEGGRICDKFVAGRRLQI